MKIYIAASFAARERLRPVRDRLFQAGHDVMSSWLDEVSKPAHIPQETFDRKLALKDLIEAGSADLIILDTLTPSTTGGSHTEFGMGLARFQRQLLYVVGPYGNIFQRLSDEQFDSWDDLFEWMDPKIEWNPTVVMADGEWLEREGNND